MTAAVAKRYPFDYDELHKGDYIEVDVLEGKTGKQCGTNDYAFAIMGLAQRIMSDTEQEGRPFIVCVVKNKLRILTDMEASAYTAQRRDAHWRGMQRANHRQALVDASGFDDAAQSLHLHRLRIGAAMVRGVNKARRSVFRLIAQEQPKQITDAGDGV